MKNILNKYGLKVKLYKKWLKENNLRESKASVNRYITQFIM